MVHNPEHPAPIRQESPTMPHTKRARRVSRQTFSARVFGLSPDTHTDSLKSYLHAAQLTPAPDQKLDLVMVDDYDHLTELVAHHGIPLAREDVPVVRVQYVKVSKRWFWAFLSMLPLLVLIAGEGQLWDIFPWK
jgi:hypothetical protein